MAYGDRAGAAGGTSTGGGTAVAVGVSGTPISISSGDNPAFSATLADLAAVASSASYQDVLSGLTTGTRINVGGFVIETVALRDTVTIAAAGNYNVTANIAGSALASTLGTARATLASRFVRTRGGVDAVLPPRGSPSYARNQYGAYSEILGTHLDMVDAFEAGDKIRVQVLFRSQATAGTFALSGIESVLSIVGEDAQEFTVTGGSGVVGWRSPATVADPYEVDDAQLLVAENGVIKRIGIDLHEGHAKMVGGSATPGTWIELGAPDAAGSRDEGGGAGAHFRGWHSRANQVGNPSEGDFFASSLYGDFESYHDITSSITGWRAYNPFAVGNYWATVSAADGTDFDVEGRGYTQADSIEQSFNEAAQSGDVFSIHSALRIVVAETVTRAAVEFQEPKATPYQFGNQFALPGWRGPATAVDPYTADDVDKHLIENGVEKIVTVDFHAGHTRVVEMQVLADIGTALAADGSAHTTGDLGNFRGFYRQIGDILSADRTDGAWYCARGIGDFEIQDPDGTFTNERWVNYNPFEVGEPWATVPDADGNDVAHVKHGFDDWRIADSFYDAESRVTAIGEAFVVLATNEVLMCVGYTAHADESAVYRAVLYIPPGSIKSIVRFWGKDQTESWPMLLPARTIPGIVLSVGLRGQRGQRAE